MEVGRALVCRASNLRIGRTRRYRETDDQRDSCISHASLFIARAVRIGQFRILSSERRKIRKFRTGDYRTRPVPELTRSAGIQVNRRVSLRRHPRALSLLHRTISPIRTHTKAKSSGDHITPAALFAFQNMGDTDDEQKSPTEPATGLRRALWPWAWLAVTGVVALAWAIALCWAAVELVRWLAG
jgi:hypothetical protein